MRSKMSLSELQRMGELARDLRRIQQLRARGHVMTFILEYIGRTSDGTTEKAELCRFGATFGERILNELEKGLQRDLQAYDFSCDPRPDDVEVCETH